MVPLVAKVTGPSISCTGLSAAPMVKPEAEACFPESSRASQTPPCGGNAAMHLAIFSPASPPENLSAIWTVCAEGMVVSTTRQNQPIRIRPLLVAQTFFGPGQVPASPGMVTLLG